MSSDDVCEAGVCSCSYLDVLQVYFDQADLVRFGQQLDARDAAELCEGGQDAQLVVDHLTHPIARPHQQGHHRLPVLELECRGSSRRVNVNQPNEGLHAVISSTPTIMVALKDFPPKDLRSHSSSR